MRYIFACACFLAALLRPALPATAEDTLDPNELQGNVISLGAATLYRLESVTVVYPAGPGENVERNRLSADTRAKYLEQEFKIRTRVRPDEELGEEEKQGNLLLLGWGNRVLGTETVPRPFSRTAEGVSLLGLEDPDPHADVLLFHRSMFNPKSVLVVWTRIDPELDRFMILPRLGSDWAIYHDYLPARQGMFTGGSTWPPARNPEAETDHTRRLSEVGAAQKSLSTEHYIIRYDPVRVTDVEVATISRARESAFAKAGEALGATPEGFRITLTVYENEQEKKERTGVDDPTHSIPRSRELHMIRRLARSSSPHEEAHHIARQIFGSSYLTALYEGLSLSVDRKWGGMDIDTRGALLLEQGALPRIEALLDEARFRSLPHEIFFPAAGLLASWLRATASPESWTRAYTLAEGTPQSLARALGRSIDEIDPAFRQWVSERAGKHEQDIAFIKAEAEAQKFHLAGDYAGMAAALERCLQARPNDPQTLFNLASAQMRAGDYSSAESRLKEILALPLGSKDARFLIFGHYQLGRLHDIQGRRAEAVAEYHRVLELPDQHEAHRLAQEAIATPVMKEQLD